MWDYRYWSSERGSGGSLWYALCRSKKWYIENIRYSLFLQRKTEKGKKHLKNCHKYSMSTENIENENLTLKGKTVIFKTLAISKTVFYLWYQPSQDISQMSFKEYRRPFCEKILLLR